MSQTGNRRQEILAKLRAIWARKISNTGGGAEKIKSPILRLRATDLADMVLCERKVYLKHHGILAEKVPLPPIQQFIQAQGVIHERKVVDPDSFTQVPIKNLSDGAVKTLEAMKAGVAKIYQGILRTDELLGVPDLLIRVEQPSRLGRHSYYPLDIKLGQNFKREHELQMMSYLYLLKQIQGVDVTGIIQLGDNSQQSVPLTPEFNTWLDKAKIIARGEVEPPPFISSSCTQCVWRQHCLGEATQVQDISLIPGIKKKVKASLQGAGIMTLTDLAAMSPQHLVYLDGIGDKTAPLIVQRAKAFVANETILFNNFFIPTQSVEVYFDVESVQIDGFGQDNTRYYLLGWCVRREQSVDFEYEYELAEQPKQEAKIWGRFLERIDGVEGPVFHYSHYEKQTIRTLCNRYGVDPRAKRLEERLVDLYPIITNNVALPLKSYSLKSVAPWLGYKWTGDTQTAADTMIEYKHWLRTGNRTHLRNILTYNEHDCRAMVMVKNWLKELLEHTQNGR